MFAYPDAARYRLGVNYQQLSSNAAHSRVYQPYERDGAMSFKGNYGGDPNYVNSQVVPVSTKKIPEEDNVHDHWAGQVTAFSTEVTDDDFVQPRMFWQNVLARQPGQQENFVGNAASFISGVKYAEIRKKTYGRLFPFPSSAYPLVIAVFAVFADGIFSLTDMFSRVDPQLGKRIEQEVTKLIGSP
jgi:catalase